MILEAGLKAIAGLIYTLVLAVKPRPSLSPDCVWNVDEPASRSPLAKFA